MSFGNPAGTCTLRLAALVVTLSFELAACGSVTTQSGMRAPVDVQAGDSSGASVSASSIKVLSVAREKLDSPYQYGGAGPDSFDCSGLVYYGYLQAGIILPRTALAQFSHTTPISADELKPGDLVFFRLGGSRVSHVGIYEGGRSFIHAPSTGRSVMSDSLDNRYWRERWVRGGRIALASP
ncbi:MAG: C40 family peptidase [Gammaproteobacteria bacterium]|nr:C40 family peptidase [Gammaproteobacteria bacterium]